MERGRSIETWRLLDSSKWAEPFGARVGRRRGFALVDGNIHFLAYDGDTVLPALATRAGSEVFESPW